ncbi:MAG: hypothetical protein U5K30_11875 [Acidimicrobiales bacterium]|nr:hypothetical protein [Acidimicrobiales bacterium]
MIWVFVVVGALVVFAIAAAFVGTEAFKLGHTPTSAIFDLDEAMYAVGDGLRDGTAVGLTYDEVRLLIQFSLEHLESKGISAMPGEEIGLDPVGPPVVVADDDAVAVVLGRADEVGLEVTDDAVLEVLDLLLAHLVAIGAIGPSVEPPSA